MRSVKVLYPGSRLILHRLLCNYYHTCPLPFGWREKSLSNYILYKRSGIFSGEFRYDRSSRSDTIP